MAISRDSIKWTISARRAKTNQPHMMQCAMPCKCTAHWTSPSDGQTGRLGALPQGNTLHPARVPSLQLSLAGHLCAAHLCVCLHRTCGCMGLHIWLMASVIISVIMSLRWSSLMRPYDGLTWLHWVALCFAAPRWRHAHNIECYIRKLSTRATILGTDSAFKVQNCSFVVLSDRDIS